MAAGKLEARCTRAERRPGAASIPRRRSRWPSWYLSEHPEVPGRLAELNRAIEREEELERGRSWERILQREQARSLGISHEVDTGLGIDL